MYPHRVAVSCTYHTVKSASRTLRPMPPTGVPAANLMFPVSYKDSFWQWWRSDLKEAEEKLLKYANIDVESDPRVKTIDTPIGRNLHINELQIEGPKVEGKENKHVVLIHGYGAAKGFFYMNFMPLGSIPGYTLHALDLLGYGRSSRPRFRVDPTNMVDGVRKAEMFFADSLEAWRRERDIPQFTLLAHSLGAYVGCAYAFKHPERVQKIALISPAGVNRTPESIPAVELGTDDASTISARTMRTPGWLRWCWDQGMSPFSIIRLAGPLGPMVTSAWSYRRFTGAGLRSEQQEAMHMYAYGVFSGTGSGEYALRHLLGPGAQSRWPLCERVKDLRCPTLWMYGDRDWMDITGGYEAAEQIKKHGGKAEVVAVKDSGHHIYLDNPEDFNELTKKFITSS